MEGIRYGLSVYVTSDKLASDTVVTLESPRPLPPVTARSDLKALMASIDCCEAFESLAKSADDWRLMTDEEIARFKKETQHA
jgi:hypothetical protein